MSGRNTVALWRFDETADLERPLDAIGTMTDLDIEGVLTRPPVIDAALGRGRRFLAAISRGFRSQDVVPGASLLQRDMSVQVVCQWNIAAQAAHGADGQLFVRGKGNSVGERVSGAVGLRVVNAAARIGELRWYWQTAAGADLEQPGGHFTPSDTEFLLLTATRRWVSSTSVILRYYLGDQLLAEHESTNGDIPGGTLGTTYLGARAGANRFFDGVIDELRVLDYELTQEEIEATWKRITIHQPRGYALFRELHDPGFPISDAPDSRVQKETRWIGNGLGMAAAQAHNIADNALPDRAYGPALEEWERIYKPIPSPRQGDAVELRRDRVLARMRQRLGASIAGVKGAIRELVGTHPDNLEFLAFDHTTVDDYGALGLNATRWSYDPPAQWTIAAGKLQVALAAAAIPFDGTTRSWYTSRMSIGGNGRGVHVLAMVELTTFVASGDTGLWIGDLARGNFLLFSLQYGGPGTPVVAYEFFTAWKSAGQVLLTGSIAWGTGWMHLEQLDTTDTVGLGSSSSPRFRFSWSTVAEIGPYTSSAIITAPANWGLPYGTQWAGHFLRTIGAAATLNVKFDDTKVRAPYGDRASRWFAYRNPALAGSPDLVASNNVLGGIKQAHTTAHVIDNKTALFDDDASLFDITPMGAI